ncbi:hypothetical protein ACFQO7_17535 [Catellatospora aurea]|uniref:DUF202 domain-containing protein n=1 Tax=Catellatospora aurea TaxID=1337874 RepID=A0ABW2H110_9ACTN
MWQVIGDRLPRPSQRMPTTGTQPAVDNPNIQPMNRLSDNVGYLRTIGTGLIVIGVSAMLLRDRLEQDTVFVCAAGALFGFLLRIEAAITSLRRSRDDSGLA